MKPSDQCNAKTLISKTFLIAEYINHTKCRKRSTEASKLMLTKSARKAKGRYTIVTALALFTRPLLKYLLLSVRLIVGIVITCIALSITAQLLLHFPAHLQMCFQLGNGVLYQRF